MNKSEHKEEEEIPTPGYRKAYEEAFGKNKRVHVISRKGRWGVKKDDKTRASRLYDEKEDAINHATGLRKEEWYVVVIHREDGTVEEWVKNVDGNTVRFRVELPKATRKKTTGGLRR